VLRVAVSDFRHAAEVLHVGVTRGQHRVPDRLRHERVVHRDAGNVQVAVGVRVGLDLALGAGLGERRLDEGIDAFSHLVIEQCGDQIALGRHRVAAESLPVEAELVEIVE